MANEHFQCDVNKAFLKRFEGNEKSLYLDITDSGIAGKGIIYLESKRNTYSGDINYDFKSIKKVERTLFEGLDSIIIYVRINTLYGSERSQVRLPNIREIDRALLLLNKIVMANDPNARAASNSSTAPASSSAPTSVAKPAPAPAPAPEVKSEPAPAPAPAPASGVKSEDAPAPKATVVEPAPAPAPDPAPAPEPEPAVAPVSAISKEEFKAKLEKLEVIYQTGMLTENEYKATKAEYVSVLNGLDAFFNKVKLNIQYNEIGFLSETEFENFKIETIEECSDLSNVTNDVLKGNLKKLLILNLFGVITDDEYADICAHLVKSVQYVSTDSEAAVTDKIEKWPILKECEIISDAQFEQFIKLVTDDTKIKMNDEPSVLEHKLTRLATLSQTFLFTPAEFESKKKELIAELTTLDFTSEAKLKGQISCLVTLNNCGWITGEELAAKKSEILSKVEANEDIIVRMQQFGSFVAINFITEEEYKGYEKKLIDDIFRNSGDITALQKKAQNLMRLKEAGIISEDDFNAYKRKLLSLA